MNIPNEYPNSEHLNAIQKIPPRLKKIANTCKHIDQQETMPRLDVDLVDAMQQATARVKELTQKLCNITQNETIPTYTQLPAAFTKARRTPQLSGKTIPPYQTPKDKIK